MRELVPTVNVWRPGAASTFGPPGDLAEAAIDQLAFTDMQGRARRWDESLPDTYTDGILVLHRGRRIYAAISARCRRIVPHSCFSITKSYAATLCAHSCTRARWTNTSASRTGCRR